MTNISNQSIRLGYVQLTDSAPLLMAEHLGLYRKYDLNVELFPQPSWSTLRDRLDAGVLDFAQMLAPMPLANRLGLTGSSTAHIAPLILSQNGNAITLSNELVSEIKQCNQLERLPFPLNAIVLKAVIEHRKTNRMPRLSFASVFHHSCHRYQLLEWINAAQISLEDIELRVIPPVMMAESLSAGHIDGFCVGGPYNASLVRAGEGQTVISSYDIWHDRLEKVLGTTESYYEQTPEVVHRMCAAILDACEWLKDIPNRFEAARILARPDALNQPLDVIAPSLIGSCLTAHNETPKSIAHYNRFSAERTVGNTVGAVSDESDSAERCSHAVNRPTSEQATWLINKMKFYDGLTQFDDSAIATCAAKSFRGDIFEQALLIQKQS